MVAHFATLVIRVNPEGIRLVLCQLLLERGSVAVVVKSLGGRHIRGSILIDGVVGVSAATVGYIWGENPGTPSVRSSRLFFGSQVIVVGVIHLNVLFVEHTSYPLRRHNFV